MMYKTKISNTKWIAYDIPGNIGWILYIVFWVKLLQTEAYVYSVLSAVPLIFMLVGIVELISERIHKLDRVLPKVRLYRGFGALTFGGIIGIFISIVGVIVSDDKIIPFWLFIGSLLCALFAGLLFAGYKKQI